MVDSRTTGRTLIAALLLGAACSHAGPPVGSPAPEQPPVATPTPERRPVEMSPRDTSGPTVSRPPVLRQPAAPAAVARLRGWMPLGETGVPLFLAAHPEWDGRGVLLGILDSGIDAGVPGLDSTSAGRPKLLDLRDFSGEGRIVLSPIAPVGDSVVVGSRRLGGFGRVRGLASAGPWYGGVLRERTLGEPPAADVNDNGIDGDTLAIVVARASDGWVLLADTDGDGSLANERPVHDFLLARETFGWHRGGEPTPLTIAANFAERGGQPQLDLFFDTSAHGTHVAGIASAHDIGHVSGFNGVAPGAQLLGLKIARNDFGGITTTGSVLAALDYAIRFAAGRGMPLVLNMSFGVGNEREGSARLDAIIDSVLAVHPEVTFVTSAGNDGPGLSTMGFPGSARRAITVGATEPWALSAAAVNGGRPAPDVLLYFSSRGGELAKPDIVAPGIAYSTVPRWNMGDEFKGGTSMASPHAAGLAAILVSAAVQERRAVLGSDIRRALTGSAIPLAGETPLDAGAGLPNLEAAWPILKGPAPTGEFDVELLGAPGFTAAFRVDEGVSDSVLRYRVTRLRGTSPVDVTLTGDVPWLRAPSVRRLVGPVDTIVVIQHPPRMPGVHVGSVRAAATGVAGSVFTLVSTVVVPASVTASPVRIAGAIPPGGARRIFFRVDSGRPFRVRSATAAPKERIIAALHQPAGQPILDENGIPGGPDTAAAVYNVDGRDARAGFYEAVAVAGNDHAVTASIRIDHSPVSLSLVPGRRDSLSTVVTSLVDSTVAGRLDIGVIGAEQAFRMTGVGGADVTTTFGLPSWVRRLVLDLELDPAEWPRFTDFGFTVVDPSGRILGKSPANYAHARLTAELPARAADMPATIVLSPAFADPGSRERWEARVTVRIEAERPVAVPTAEGDEFKVPARGKAALHGKIADLPWAFPPGFVPLTLLMVESGGITWTWQMPAGAGPVLKP